MRRLILLLSVGWWTTLLASVKRCLPLSRHEASPIGALNAIEGSTKPGLRLFQ